MKVRVLFCLQIQSGLIHLLLCFGRQKKGNWSRISIFNIKIFPRCKIKSDFCFSKIKYFKLFFLFYLSRLLNLGIQLDVKDNVKEWNTEGCRDKYQTLGYVLINLNRVENYFTKAPNCMVKAAGWFSSFHNVFFSKYWKFILVSVIILWKFCLVLKLSCLVVY